MTFISAIANEKHVSVMSDGQLTGPDGVLKEDVKKIHVFDDTRFFVASAGSKDYADQVASIIPTLNTMGLDLKGIAVDIQKAFMSDVPRSKGYEPIQTLVGGRNKNNQIVMYTASNAFNSLEEIGEYIPQNEVLTVYLHSSEHGYTYSYDETNKFFAGYLINRNAMTGNDLEINSVKLAQEDLNRFVEELDTTVNNVTTCYQIAKLEPVKVTKET